MSRSASTRYHGRVITAGHIIVFSQDPEADRAFFDKVLKYPHVDAGEGWLIFKLPPTELAVHPAGGPDAGRQEFYLMCDDIQTTVEELTGKGVELTGPVSDEGFGLVTAIKLPGGGELGLYEPRHPTALQS